MDHITYYTDTAQFKVYKGSVYTVDMVLQCKLGAATFYIMKAVRSIRFPNATV